MKHIITIEIMTKPVVTLLVNYSYRFKLEDGSYTSWFHDGVARDVTLDFLTQVSKFGKSKLHQLFGDKYNDSDLLVNHVSLV